ncbi:hypothetical protein [Ancylobacter terrae]|uniref:hypothetical protein n=1 Tax=Ancylobacter sp. sgz301288 TaxID=3342077 RepID=UPI00385A7983
MPSRRSEMPLYPSEAEIAEAVLGTKRSAEWKSLAVILERHGLPKVSHLTGARYWPSVRAWLDRYNGLGTMPVPSRPDGVEKPVP